MAHSPMRNRGALAFRRLFDASLGRRLLPSPPTRTLSPALHAVMMHAAGTARKMPGSCPGAYRRREQPVSCRMEANILLTSLGLRRKCEANARRIVCESGRHGRRGCSLSLRVALAKLDATVFIMPYAAIFQGWPRASLRGRFDQIIRGSETLPLLHKLLEAEACDSAIFRHECLRDLYRHFTSTFILNGTAVATSTIDALAFPRLREDLAELQGRREWASVKIMSAISTAVPWPIQLARVTSMAKLPSESGDRGPPSRQETIRLRIQKCLARANHPNTPEAEARTSFNTARRLMLCHDVSQAHVLADVCEFGNPSDKGDESVVSIVRTRDQSRKVLQFAWVDTLGYAITIFFHCKAYSSGSATSLKWVFCGIAANTASAAASFEMLHNLATEWAAIKSDVYKKDDLLGFAHGLLDMAYAERKTADKEAKAQDAKIRSENNEKKRKDELRRLQKLERFASNVSFDAPQREFQNDFSAFDPASDDDEPGFASDTESLTAIGSKDNDTDDQFGSDTDTSVKDETDIMGGKWDDNHGGNKHSSNLSSSNYKPSTSNKRKRSTSISHPGQSAHKSRRTVNSDDLEPCVWQRHSALVLFRKTAERVADEYLKAKGIKLCNGRARSHNIRDARSHEKGQRDARTVDVRSYGRKRLK
ncbi:hypothetical protein FH972_025476 [Carpinus fangiana]|uniref:Uncharacterized protein n=1 Tax=Carpinus fangiana TaxID=176857 RepID=A0A5N6L3Q7_9ROSI|nr:hypothetical protein FH972_025476 [Carpinus fangiana]